MLTQKKTRTAKLVLLPSRDVRTYKKLSAERFSDMDRVPVFLCVYFYAHRASHIVPFSIVPVMPPSNRVYGSSRSSRSFITGTHTSVSFRSRIV